MHWPRRKAIGDFSVACLLWLGLGFSLGWYYTFTYYGRSGWPMPIPESNAALILYYFSVVNAATEIQAIHWMLVFPLAGVLWVSVLTVTAPFFGGRRVEYAWTLARFSVTCIPLVAVGPVMAYVAGQTGGAFSGRHMVAVALRRAGVMPGSWLTGVYVALAAMGLAWQLLCYVRVFDIHGRKAWLHFFSSASLLVLLASGLGALAAFPLRAWLE